MKLLVAFFHLAMAVTASAATLAERTFLATVVHVVDGDTIYVSIPGFPEPYNPAQVRLDGIDTPESRKNDAKCSKELRLGLIAKAWLKDKLPVGAKVSVVWTGKHEKFGRLLATIYAGTENINETLVRLGHAVEYHGQSKSSWCHINPAK